VAVDSITLVGQGDGLHMVGTFLGFRDRKPRTVGARTYEGCDVGIQMESGTVETVQYQSRARAEAALAGVDLGARVALPCVNRYGVKDGAVWQFYTGAGATGSDAFASEFTA